METFLKKLKLSIVAVLISIFSSGVSVMAQVQNAAVTGGRVEGVLADGVVSFKGIPFAAPPIRDLRWRAPDPVKPWSGVKKADSFGVMCMQDATMVRIFGGSPEMGEDCLYLNVWTPAKSTGDKLPVMVWIYGGGFFGGLTGSPAYDGFNFAKEGVVMVSIAYRVGVFGFLAHPELSSERAKVPEITHGSPHNVVGSRMIPSLVHLSREHS